MDNYKRTPFAKLPKILAGVFAVIAAAVIVFTGYYSVDEQSQAVVTTFGKVTAIESAGPHLKIPFIQRAQKVPVNIAQKLTIGYYTDNAGDDQFLMDESRIMTGDDNIVCVDFFLEWKISDPVDYLYNAEDPEQILKMLAQSAARNIIGSELVDEVLTTGKDRIQTAIEDKIRENLAEYDIGVQILDLKIQDAEPPTAEVRAAFKAVEDAKLQKDTLITQANTYSEQQMPQAEAKADKLLKDAEAYYQAREAEATGEIDRFNSIYTEYAKYPEAARSRMYLEVMEKLLPQMDIYINTTDGGTSTLIPVKDLVK